MCLSRIGVNAYHYTPCTLNLFFYVLAARYASSLRYIEHIRQSRAPLMHECALSGSQGLVNFALYSSHRSNYSDLPSAPLRTRAVYEDSRFVALKTVAVKDGKCLFKKTFWTTHVNGQKRYHRLPTSRTAMQTGRFKQNAPNCVRH